MGNKKNYLGVGIAVGVPFGIAIGESMHNVGAGIPIGVALGVAIGMVMNKRHEDPSQPTRRMFHVEHSISASPMFHVEHLFGAPANIRFPHHSRSIPARAAPLRSSPQVSHRTAAFCTASSHCHLRPLPISFSHHSVDPIFTIESGFP